jgi:hypothetical protein
MQKIGLRFVFAQGRLFWDDGQRREINYKKKKMGAFPAALFLRAMTHFVRGMGVRNARFYDGGVDWES